jgi:hypothetical protein
MIILFLLGLRESAMKREKKVAVGFYFFILSWFIAVSVRGVVYEVPAGKPMSISLPGGFAALANPDTGKVYTSDIYGDEEFSYPIIFDTGTSGNLMSNFVNSSLGVPLTGETYTDQGIGGMETFDVSARTQLRLAPISVGEDGANDLNNYAAIGNYKFQVRREENEGYTPFDIVGTPILRNSVLKVRPNTIPYSSWWPTLDYMDSTLLSSMPTTLSGQSFKIPIQYKNFVTVENPAVDVDFNPVIPGVQIVDSRKDADHQSAPIEWLLDTGATVTIIGRDYASRVGIDLDSEDPLYEVTVEGIGGDQVALFGYLVDQIALPLSDGAGSFIFKDAVVFVPDIGALPADIPGILGMNLLGQSFSEIDSLFGVPLDLQDSPFTEWYIDSPGQTLTLNMVPLPGTFCIVLIGSIMAFLRKRGWDV